MLDEIRRNDWAPRSVHKKSREISETMHLIEQRNGRNATDREVAAELGMDINDYHHHLQDSTGHQLFSLDDFTDSDQTQASPLSTTPDTPENEVHDDDFQHALAQAIDTLPDRERMLMSLYYNDELNLKEIGEILGVSESRVSQIHSQTVLRLRSKLRDWIMQ
jgi:RNA polymerase sigma factor for flagellar operon FliA